MVRAMRFVQNCGTLMALAASLGVGCAHSKGMQTTKAEKMASKSTPLKTTKKKSDKPESQLADNGDEKVVPKVNVSADVDPVPQPLRKPSISAKPAVTSDGGVSESMVKQVGKQLAAANPLIGKQLDFETVHNRRPDSFHTPSGTVYLSSGMLEQLKNEDDLASVLSLEIARLFAEQELLSAEPSLAKGDEKSDKSEKAVPVSRGTDSLLTPKEPPQEKVLKIAQKILTNSGYKSDGLAALQTKLEKVASATKVRQKNNGLDPRVQGMFISN